MTMIATELPEGYGDFRSPAELPELNSELLFDLLSWARHDEDMADKFKDWGTWEQGTWGMVSTDLLVRQGFDPSEPAQTSTAVRNGLCGTAYCMAGAAATHTNHRLILGGGGYGLSAMDCVAEEPTGQVNDKGIPIWRDVPGAPRRSISEVGREVLGLTYDESSTFFNGDNTLARLEQLANLFCDARGLPLLVPDAPIGPLYGSTDPERDGDDVYEDDEEPEQDDDF